ncbi:hypothetical protein PHYSODRAFT_502384, partial [Phytophthora sojae]
VDLLPLVQANLNQTPVPSLADFSPIEVFTGLECPYPLKSIAKSTQTRRNKRSQRNATSVNFHIGGFVLPWSTN